ncbi:unnamed protein product, partial [Ectocarpus sp. 4 AP-2014]
VGVPARARGGTRIKLNRSKLVLIDYIYRCRLVLSFHGVCTRLLCFLCSGVFFLFACGVPAVETEHANVGNSVVRYVCSVGEWRERPRRQKKVIIVDRPSCAVCTKSMSYVAL